MQIVDSAAQHLIKRHQRKAVDPDALMLHLCKHSAKRQFYRIVKTAQAFLLQKRRKRIAQLVNRFAFLRKRFRRSLLQIPRGKPL